MTFRATLATAAALLAAPAAWAECPADAATSSASGLRGPAARRRHALREPDLAC